MKIVAAPLSSSTGRMREVLSTRFAKRPRMAILVLVLSLIRAHSAESSGFSRVTYWSMLRMILRC